jgi:hypothetical protein
MVLHFNRLVAVVVPVVARKALMPALVLVLRWLWVGLVATAVLAVR